MNEVVDQCCLGFGCLGKLVGDFTILKEKNSERYGFCKKHEKHAKEYHNIKIYNLNNDICLTKVE